MTLIYLLFLSSQFNNHRYGAYAQNRYNSNRINRIRGNILQNLTLTHAYDDNIVTSQLDASKQVRQIYRSIRNLYNK